MIGTSNQYATVSLGGMDAVLGLDPLVKCDYCDKGYAVRDVDGDTRAWIEGEEFIIQEFDKKTDRPFERKFKIKYCPYCGRMIKKDKSHCETRILEGK